MKGKNLSILVSVIFSVFTWGSNFNIMASLSVSPMTGSAVRFGIAALLLLIMRGYQKRPESKLSARQMYHLVLLGVVGIFCQNLALFVGMKDTSAFNGALIVSTAPVAAMIFSVVILGTRIHPAQLIGVLLSLTGVGLVITNGNWQNLHFSSGDIYICLGMLSGALFTVLSKKWASTIPVTQTSRWAIVSGSILLAFLATVYEEPIAQLSMQSPISILILVYMGVVSTVLAYRFWMRGAIELGPNNVMACFNLMPVFTLLINFCLGHPPKGLQVAGIALVSFGVFLSCNLVSLSAKSSIKEMTA